MISPQPQLDTESRDGVGAGDHDQPYRFGGKPRASVPLSACPLQRGFNTCQYGRLLVLRGRVRDGLRGADDVAA